jgi:hypothetical protein
MGTNNHDDRSMNVNNQEIIELAALSLAIDKTPDDAALVQQYEERLGQAEEFDTLALLLARNLLQGRGFGIHSDYSERNGGRLHSLAVDLGATVQEDTLCSCSSFCLQFVPGRLQ